MSTTGVNYVLSLKDLLTAKLKEANASASKLDGTMNGLSSGLAKGFALIGGVALGKQILDTGVQFEYLGASMKVLLGSGEAANKMLKDIKDTALTTPFEISELGTASKQLLAFGIESQKIIPTIRMLGDVASGIGAPIGDIAYLFGTIKTQGRAMTMDINQFANRGIPIWEELATLTGKSGLSLRKLVEGGKIGFPEITKAFEHMTGKGGKFFDMMKEQSLTVGGQLSNLKDKLSQSFLAIFQELKPQINSVIIGLSGLIDKIIPLIHWIKEHSSVVKGLAVALGSAYLLGAIQKVTIALSAMSATPIGALIVGLSTVIGLFYAYNDLKNEQQKKAFKTGTELEIENVRKLQKEYEKLGVSKEKSLWVSISAEKIRLNKELKTAEENKLKYGSISGYENEANKKISKLRGELTVLDSMKRIDENTKKAKLKPDSKLKAGETPIVPVDLNTGSSSVKGQGIQNLTINIDKLVEALNVTANNVTESAIKIKEEVAKALLSAVNDINILARN